MYTLRTAVQVQDLQQMCIEDETLFARRKCLGADHEPIRRQRGLWMEKTIPGGIQGIDYGLRNVKSYLELGHCIDCGSLLAWFKPLSEEEVETRVIIP